MRDDPTTDLLIAIRNHVAELRRELGPFVANAPSPKQVAELCEAWEQLDQLMTEGAELPADWDDDDEEEEEEDEPFPLWDESDK